MDFCNNCDFDKNVKFMTYLIFYLKKYFKKKLIKYVMSFIFLSNSQSLQQAMHIKKVSFYRNFKSSKILFSLEIEVHLVDCDNERLHTHTGLL